MGSCVPTPTPSTDNSSHHWITSSTVLKMKIAMKLFILFSFCWMMMDAYPIEDDLPKHPGPDHFVASRPEMLQDLTQRLAEDYPIQEGGEESERPKRRWWGNKYKDNKSYGFWITALNISLSFQKIFSVLVQLTKLGNNQIRSVQTNVNRLTRSLFSLDSFNVNDVFFSVN